MDRGSPQKQSEIQKTRRSWKHSTGPKTVAGKKRSSLNAYKHGLKSRAAFEIRQSLREHSQFLTYINRYITAAKRKRRLDAMLTLFKASSPFSERAGVRAPNGLGQSGPHLNPLPEGRGLSSLFLAKTFKTAERTRQNHPCAPDFPPEAEEEKGEGLPFPPNSCYQDRPVFLEQDKN